MPNKRTIPRICQQCGIEFLAVKVNVDYGFGNYCSKSCARKAQPRTKRPVDERFHEKTEKTNGCWLWRGWRNPKGYGYLGVNGRMVSTHRLAWELVAGPIPEGMHVLHTCDNPSCVRNDDEGFYELSGILHPRRGHLWLGMNEDNTTDKMAKGRQSQGEMSGSVLHPERLPRGEQKHDAKLRDQDIPIIRQRIAAGETLVAIAKSYGVVDQTIRMLRDGKTWKHVP